MQTISQRVLSGERALFKSRDLDIRDCVFEDGESPLKESSNILVSNSIFRWKYPFWYDRDVQVRGCALLEMARAGMWYTRNILFQDCTVEAPKGFRHCQDVRIVNTQLANAAETLWWNEGVTLQNVQAKGDYFAKNCTGVRADGLQLVGNYCFDGCRDVEVSNARLLSKDAFWNCEDVLVRDSFITGEYLGWNSRNLTFENCTIESLQGLCYIEGLTLRNCRLINTTLAFEYCSGVDAQVATVIDSVKNPRDGVIRAAGFGEIIMDDDELDASRVSFVVQG